MPVKQGTEAFLRSARRHVPTVTIHTEEEVAAELVRKVMMDVHPDFLPQANYHSLYASHPSSWLDRI